MKEVKVGLIGLGFMGSTHWRIYGALPGVRVVALADVDAAKRAGDISKVVGNIGGGDNSAPLDMTGVAVYEDALKMIAETNADIIDVCVPTPKHKEYILAALKAGKHVFSEKPLCRSLEEIAEIRKAVKASDKFFNVGMCIRAWPEYDSAKAILDSGKLGKVKSALFRRLSPSVDGNAWQNWFMNDAMSGGAALDLHTHDTDFVCYLFGDPKAVRSAGVRGAVSDNGVDHIITAYDFADGKLITYTWSELNISKEYKSSSKISGSTLGANYTPVVYIGSQQVNGTNHAFLCEASLTAPDSMDTYAIVVLYEDFDHNVSISDIFMSGVRT